MGMRYVEGDEKRSNTVQADLKHGSGARAAAVGRRSMSKQV